MRLLKIFLIAILCLFQYFFWFSKNGYMDYQQVSQDIEIYQAENLKLSQRNQEITAEIKDLKDGINAIQERARLQYEMVKPNETFYRIVKSQKNK